MIAAKLQAGDTLTWTESVSDYPASAGWTLKYNLNGATANIALASSASGDDHVFTVTAATSAAYVAGSYKFQRYVTKAGGLQHTLDTGTVEILQNIITASAGATVSHVKTVLDAIEAMIEGRATKAQKMISIAGRTIEYLTITELHAAWMKYRLEYRAELNAERIAQGLGGRRKIVTRSTPVA